MRPVGDLQQTPVGDRVGPHAAYRRPQHDPHQPACEAGHTHKMRGAEKRTGAEVAQSIQLHLCERLLGRVSSANRFLHGHHEENLQVPPQVQEELHFGQEEI